MQIHAQRLTNGVTLGGRGSERSVKKCKPPSHVTVPLPTRRDCHCHCLPANASSTSPTGPRPWLPTSLALLHGSVHPRPDRGEASFLGCPSLPAGLSKQGSRVASLSPHQTSLRSEAPFRGICYQLLSYLLTATRITETE